MSEKIINEAINYAAAHDIKSIVIASVTGATLPLLYEKFEGNIVCVTHAYGYMKPGECEFSEDLRTKYTALGVKFVTAAHVLSGAERGISNTYKGMYPVEIMAQTLRMFGAGTKVAVECAVMALDAGVIPFGQKVISLGGTGRGQDTAVVLTPANANNIFKTKIHYTICKPE